MFGLAVNCGLMCGSGWREGVVVDGPWLDLWPALDQQRLAETGPDPLPGEVPAGCVDGANPYLDRPPEAFHRQAFGVAYQGVRLSLRCSPGEDVGIAVGVCAEAV